MLDILPVVAVLLLGSLGMIWVNARFSAWEVQVLLGSLAAHLLACFAQIWIVYEVYGVGDMVTYQRVGVEVAAAARQDPAGVLPQWVRMLFQQEVHLNVYTGIGGESTQSMFALSALGNLLLMDSLYAVCLAFTWVSFYGKVLLYKGFRDLFERHYRLRLLIATTCVPSVIYWTAGMVKEAVALTGMACMLLGGSRLLKRRRGADLLLVGAGSVLVGLIKPHLLFGMVVGAGVWLYWHRSMGPEGVRIRPLYLVLGAGAAVGGLLILGEIFPRFSLDAVAEEAAQQQFYATRTGAGSTYSIGDPTNRSLLGQLSWAPLALFTSLYRPLIFEARNPQMLVNALETTALLVLTAKAVQARGLGGVWSTINRRPALVFCLVLTLGLGVMTGLASANLGTLSRYRVPMVPFFVALVGVCSAPVRTAARQEQRGGPLPAAGPRRAA